MQGTPQSGEGIVAPLRLFIALPLPEKIRTLLARALVPLKKRGYLPDVIRWVPEAYWHFTLVFLGVQHVDAMESICRAMRETYKIVHRETFHIKCDSVRYGPSEREMNARMIWLTTDEDTSRRLGILKKTLETRLETEGIKWERVARPFRGHLTLARFADAISIHTLPRLSIPFPYAFDAEALVLMESHLKRSGAEYEEKFRIARS